MSEHEPAAGDTQSPTGGGARGRRSESALGAETPPPAPRGEAGTAAPKYCPHCGEEYDAALNFCPRDGNILQVRHGEHDLVGQVLGRQYRILELLGEGGMGQVFLAEHVRIGRRCAIKVMRPALVRDPGAVGRFGREATTAGRINHRNAAAVYDFGETEDGLIYIVMEHVDGAPLSHLLATSGALPPSRAVEIAIQITDALTAAHRLGIIHRDLKPDNILVARDEDGRDLVKVVDFGIAKAINDGSQAALTRTGFVLGTLQYMSPEQLIGEPLDGRSDLYSVGCVLFEMLTGERTFAGPSGPAAVARRLTEPAPSPRSRNAAVPAILDGIVTRSLARMAADRFPSAEAMRATLKQALASLTGGLVATDLIAPVVPAPPPPLTPGHQLPAAAMVAPAAPKEAELAAHDGEAAGATAADGSPAAAAFAEPAATPPAAPAAPTDTSEAAAALREPVVPPPAAALAAADASEATPESFEPVATPADAAPAAEDSAAGPEAELSAPAVGVPAPADAGPAPVSKPRGKATFEWEGVAAASRATLKLRRPALIAGLVLVGATLVAVLASRATRSAGEPASAAAGSGIPASDAGEPTTPSPRANQAAGSQPSPPAPQATAGKDEGASREDRASAKPASLLLSGTLPANSRVLVDGRPARDRELTHLTPGPHTIAVVAPGLPRAVWRGSLEPGETRTWRPSIARADEAEQPPTSAPAAQPSQESPARAAYTPPAPSAGPYSAPAPATTQAAPPEERPERSADALVARTRGVAAALADAIKTRDAGALRRAWPGITPEAERRWQLFLTSADNREVDARVTGTRSPHIDGTTATTGFTLTIGFTNRSSGHTSAKSRFVATFQWSGSDWILTAVRADS